MHITETIQYNKNQVIYAEKEVYKLCRIIELSYSFLFVIGLGLCLFCSYYLPSHFQRQINNDILTNLIYVGFSFSGILCLAGMFKVESYIYTLFLKGKKSRLLWMIPKRIFEQKYQMVVDAENTFFNPETFNLFFDYLNVKRKEIPVELLRDYDNRLSSIKLGYLNKSNYIISDIREIFSIIGKADFLIQKLSEHTKIQSDKAIPI